MNDIATAFKAIRKKEGLTQKDFAERIGLKQNNYSMIESGKNNPTFETIRNVISTFNVDANLFFNEAGMVVHDTMSTIEAALRENRQNYLSNINSNKVDLIYSRKLYKSLEKQFPDLYSFKISLDNISAFSDALAELDNVIIDRVREAFWTYPGVFNYSDYEKNAIELLKSLKSFNEPINKLSLAIEQFYKSMQSIPENSIEFEHYLAE